MKGKGINYCRVPGEICKLNSEREREREGGIFLFFSPSFPVSTRRVSTNETAATPCFDYARLIPLLFSIHLKFSEEQSGRVSGQFELTRNNK